MRSSAVPYVFLTLPAILPATLAAQQPTAFEVISIKPNAAADNRVMIQMAPGGRFTATGIPVRLLIAQAFNIRDFQISGGPGWMTSARFDVNAKAPDGLGERVPPEVLRPMLQAMLAERFQLKTHTETKEMPVYSLVPAKGGLKVKVSPAPAPGAQGQGPRGIRMGRGQITGTGMSSGLLAMHLAQILGRPVTDQTSIDGVFDIDMDFTPEPGLGGVAPAGTSNGPSVFTALQEKLGLKLESTKGPVEILVIDSVAKPEDN